MAFLDNSGDIILDAVLTDTGRMRLARGDGSFRIAKFALGDDEINYGLYDKTNTNGSAYYDLDILQTPVLEAFTNNTSFLKSKLVTIPRTNLLYLPVMEINEEATGYPRNPSLNTWVATADSATALSLNTGVPGAYIDAAAADPLTGITIDQGLDTVEIPATFALDPDLIENQYIIEIDNRLGQITSVQGSVQAVSFLDDDNIASYYISQVGGDLISTDLRSPPPAGPAGATISPISGPRGTRLKFSIKSSVELQSSEFLFNKLGTTDTTSALADIVTENNYLGLKYIDTIVRITGGQTGYRIDVPLRLIKAYK